MLKEDRIEGFVSVSFSFFFSSPAPFLFLSFLIKHQKDLHRMYLLFRRSPNGLELMKEVMGDYVREVSHTHTHTRTFFFFVLNTHTLYAPTFLTPHLVRKSGGYR